MNHLHQVMRQIFIQTLHKEPYPFQELIMEEYDYPRRIVKKSRQTGCSTTYALIALVKAVLLGRDVLVVSPSERQSIHFMTYIKKFLVTLKQLIPELIVDKDNSTELSFSSGGTIKSLPNQPNTIRGMACSDLVLDEFGHFLLDSDRDIVEAILPSMTRGISVTFISTPYGERGLFYSMCCDEPNNVIEARYTECRDVDIEPIRRSMDEMSFRQEYLLEFVGEADSYFPYELIHSCVQEDVKMVTSW